MEGSDSIVPENYSNDGSILEDGVVPENDGDNGSGVGDCDVEGNGEENEDDNDMHIKLSKKLLKYISKNKRNEMLFEVLITSYGHEEVQKWMSKSLGMGRNRLKKKINHYLYGIDYDKRGRPAVSKEIRKVIIDTWLNASIVSVDRRNGRDFVSLAKKKYTQRYGMEINDDMSGTTVEVNKRDIIVVKVLRMITTATVMEIQRELKKMNIDVSCGSIWKFKPFFINSPSEREKLACLYMTCLNTRNVFDALMIVARDNGLQSVYTT